MKPKNTRRSIYEIRVEGVLGDMWADWFEGLRIRKENDRESGRPISVLYGPVTDQPALHGVLARISDLNLTLLSVKMISQETKDGG